MMQELFRIPGLGIPVFGYGLMLVIGFYLAMQVGRALARRSGVDPDVVVNVALIALVFGIAGSRLSHILENLDEYTRSELTFAQNFWNAVNIRSGGLTFYGGFLLATAACVTYGVVKRIPLRLGMDIIAPCVMIGLGFGRIGCFLNGCCYGAECDAPWAVNFPYHSNAYIDQYERGEVKPPPELLVATPDGRTILKPTEEAKREPAAAALLREKTPGVTEARAVHPSQLYSTLTAFLLACLLVAYFTTQPVPGRVFALMLILEAPSRFLLEMLRAEPTVLGPMSFSMVMSIPLFVIGVVMWFVVGKMDPRRPRGFDVLPLSGATPASAG
jgi:phosphatidylglycerol:prolipoprotein diacylglycerol transferase